MLSSTHTHAGPAGFLQYVLYIITSQGFILSNFEAIVIGIMKVLIKKFLSIFFSVTIIL